MEHPRTLIREAVVTLLTNATSAGPRVFDTRVDPYKTSAPPVISVYTLSDQVDAESAKTAPRELERTTKLEVVCWVRDSAALPVGRAMDRVAREVELKLNAANFPPLGGLAADFVIESTEMEVLRDGDPLLGVIALTYAVKYYDDVDAAALAADDFLRAGVTTQVTGGVADTAPIEDLVTVQETTP